ncbi:uncharacterized protein LOC113293804 isoform X2 [Papaver somniferum]|uniref:uncharacterized protein LOC113293804 isoform X2 n=1 Tax=Papaver somniferum TaxID=3469 RepID=UPI000E6F4C1A|nr:uncharacterized protein LOC113293804 isoform X2 [Papaver somniferum]
MILDAYLTGGAKKMFVQIPERGRFLFFLFSKVIIEISCENLASSKDLIVMDSNLNWRLQMLAVCGTVNFLLQLEFCLFHEIAVHSFGSLVVTQIHFVSFECVFKVLMFNTFTILHHGFLYLQSWSLFHIVIWIHMDQGTWFNQRVGTSAFFGLTSSQMSQVASSAGDFSYENLIFVLIPSLVYHSDFSAIHLTVLLCITDADIVDERTLTVTMAARTGNLSHLAKSLVWRLRSGDATAFILSELWEIRAMEKKHKQWLPKPTEVNLLVCTDAHLHLNVLIFEAYVRFSISDGVAYYVENYCNTRSQNFNVNYFYMLLTQLPSCTTDFTKLVND